MMSVAAKISSDDGSGRAVAATARRGDRRGRNGSNGGGVGSAWCWRRKHEGDTKTMVKG